MSHCYTQLRDFPKGKQTRSGGVARRRAVGTSSSHSAPLMPSTLHRVPADSKSVLLPPSVPELRSS